MKINLFDQYNFSWIPVFAGMTKTISFILVLAWLIFCGGQAKADAATTTVNLRVETNDGSLYGQDIAVIACADSATVTTTTVNAKCAIEQSGLLSDSSWWGDDVFLNSIGSYVNNDGGNGVYWAWFSNLEYGQVALNKHMLFDGEILLLTYNVNPLKISVDDAAPYVNATSTITLEQFGLDASWNPAWLPAASSTLVINGEEIENISGVYEYTATATAPVLIYGKKGGYIDSEEISIAAQEIIEDNNESENGGNNQSSGGSVIIPAVSGSASAVVSPLKVDLGKAIDFLITRQGVDGSFGSSLMTDWAALGLASANPNGSAAQKIKNYLLADPNPLAGMNIVSDYSRRAMALMSLNINPYNGTKTNYINKIIESFDGRQFGNVSLYNDDIFALLALSKAGYGTDDEVIKKTTDFIIAKQQFDGSWASSDLTAAAVQTLTPMSSLIGVAPALQKARNFLFNAQGADGGFGNTYTTAWAMQAIAALGESSDAWQKNNNTPENYLALSQGADGGLEKDNVNEVNRIWSTAYAIPAIQGKPWFNIMQNFSKQNTSVFLNAADSADANENNTATSTSENLEIASSSPKDLITASTTEISLQIETDEEKIITEPVEAVNAAPEPAKQAAPKVLGAAATFLKTIVIKDNKVEKKQDQEIAENGIALTAVSDPDLSPANDNSIIITKTTVEEKTNAAAKKLLYVAGAGAVIVGIFLGLKLLLLLL